MSEDLSLKCRECREEFVWTAGEQGFYEQHDLARPARCKPCRAKRKAQSQGPVEPRGPIVETRRPSNADGAIVLDEERPRQKRRGSRYRQEEEGADW